MRPLFGSLSAKLILLLTIFIGAQGLFYLVLTLMATQAHLQAVDQSLNLNVARSMLDSTANAANADAAVDFKGQAFSALMELNPNAEIYLLDGSGSIVSHAAPKDTVKLKAVAIEPIAAFMTKSAPLPIYGDDPRHPEERKVFSAAEITRSGAKAGYLYVVLGGEAHRRATDMFRESYILRLSSGLIGGSVLVAVLLGAVSFYRLTKPLRHLTHSVSAFNPRQATADGLGLALQINTDDEVGRLAHSFDQMARRISDQMLMLKQADDARREFMVYISHDLKNPIASVRSYLETLMMKWEDMERDQRDGYIASALKANDRTFMLVEGIFELAKLETPEAPLQIESFSVTELIQDICQKLQLEAGKARVTLAVDWQEPNVFIAGDIGLIERALANIIENAIKFSEAGKGVRIKVASDADRVLISVASQGNAIAEDELQKIFMPFYRGRNAGRNSAGTGLGLPIARRVAELHDGFIEVANVGTTGTVFTVGLRANATGASA